MNPWLCSTHIKPDVAVYFDSEMAIHYLLIEVFSNNMLQTARETAIKLILQLQLKRLLGCTEDEVIGFAFASIGREIPDSVSVHKTLSTISEKKEFTEVKESEGEEEVKVKAESESEGEVKVKAEYEVKMKKRSRSKQMMHRKRREKN